MDMPPLKTVLAVVGGVVATVAWSLLQRHSEKAWMVAQAESLFKAAVDAQAKTNVHMARALFWQARVAYDDAGDWAGAARCREHMALLLIEVDPPAASDHLQQSIDAYREHEAWEQCFALYGRLADVYKAQKEWLKAVRCHEERVDVAKSISPAREMEACVVLGRHFEMVGNMLMAFNSLQRAMKIAVDTDDLCFQYTICVACARLSLAMDDEDSAENGVKFAVTALSSACELGHKLAIAHASLLVAEVHLYAGESDRSHTMLLRARTTLREVTSQQRADEAGSSTGSGSGSNTTCDPTSDTTATANASDTHHHTTRMDTPSAEELMMELCACFGRWYVLQRNHQKALDFYKSALSKARVQAAQHAQVRFLTDMGTLYHEMGDQRRALRSLHSAMKLIKECSDAMQMGARVLCMTARVFRAKGNLVAAVKYFKKSVLQGRKYTVYRVSREKTPEEATTWFYMGVAMREQGNFKGARESLLKALRAGKRSAPVLEALGDVSVESDPDRALTYYLAIVNGHVEESTPEHVLRAHMGCGVAYVAMHKKHAGSGTGGSGAGGASTRGGSGVDKSEHMDNAVEHLEKTVAMAATCGDVHSQCKACVLLGDVLRSIGRWGAALEVHERQLELTKQMKSREEEAAAYARVGTDLWLMGQFDRAIQCHHHDMDISQQVGSSCGEVRASWNLSSAYGLLGDFSKATLYNARWQELNRHTRVQDARVTAVRP